MIRAVIAAVVLCGAANTAAAQIENSTAFSVERFTPAPGQGGLLGTEEAEVLPHLWAAFGIASSLMSRPIVLERVGTRDEVLAPVDTRLSAELSAAVGLAERYQVGLALPVVLGQSGDRLMGIGFDESELDSFAAGDVRIHGKAQLAGAGTTPGARAAVVTSISFPTGNQNHFAGEAGEVLSFGIVGGYRGQWWRVGGHLGARFRSREVTLFTPSRPHGNELAASVAVAVTIDPVDVIAEYASVFGVCRDKQPGGGCAIEGHSPAEARLGARISIARSWTALVGAGVGTTPDDVGSPAWRLLAGATWMLPRR